MKTIFQASAFQVSYDGRTGGGVGLTRDSLDAALSEATRHALYTLANGSERVRVTIREVCATCEGEGLVLKRDSKGRERAAVFAGKRTCPDCKGRGEVRETSFVMDPGTAGVTIGVRS